MGNIVVLAGPQAIGKTRKAGQLCEALGCSMIADNWDGKTDHGISVLYITNAVKFITPDGARVIEVHNDEEVDALIATSEAAAPSGATETQQFIQDWLAAPLLPPDAGRVERGSAGS